MFQMYPFSVRPIYHFLFVQCASPCCLPEFCEETPVCVSLPCLDVNVHGVTLPRCERARICIKTRVCMESHEKCLIETSCIQTLAITPHAFTAYAFTAYTYLKKKKKRGQVLWTRIIILHYILLRFKQAHNGWKDLWCDCFIVLVWNSFSFENTLNDNSS